MPRGAVAHTLRLGLLVAGVLAVYGCGGGAKPLSEEYGSLSPSRYVAEEFQPALSFEVGKGWEVSELEQKSFFELSREYEGGDYFVSISFNNPPAQVSDPRTLTSLCLRPKTGSPGTKSTPTSTLRAPADERRGRRGEALRHGGLHLARGLLQ